MSTFVVEGYSAFKIASGAMWVGVVNSYIVGVLLIFSNFFEIPKSPMRRISNPLGCLLINMLSGFKSL
jgi:hypothetical protein